MKKSEMRLEMESVDGLAKSTEHYTKKYKCYNQAVYAMKNMVRATGHLLPKAKIPVSDLPLFFDSIFDMTVRLPKDGLRLKLVSGKKLIGTVLISKTGITYVKANKKLKPKTEITFTFLEALHTAQG